MTHSLASTVIYNHRDINVQRCTDLAIANIINDTDGRCEFNAGQTCAATHIFSAEVVNEQGPLTYNWSSSIGAFTNSDTDEVVQLIITSNTEVAVDITVEVSDGVSTTTHTQTFISHHVQV